MPTLDREAFAVLYAQHRDALHRYCLSRTGDPARADDIVQDVFEKAYLARDRFDPARPFWPWLASIAARECVDSHRRRAAATARMKRFARANHREPFDNTSTTVLQQLERFRIEHEIQQLPARQRIALQLFALDGWTYAEIAAQFDYSVATVKALIVRARTRLRDVATGSVTAAVAGVQAVRRRLRHLACRTQLAFSSVTASGDAAGAWATGLASNASVVVAVVAVTLGLLAPAGTAIEQEGAGVAIGHDAWAAPVGPPPEPTAAPTVVGAPPTSAPVTGAVERAAHGLVADALPASDEDKYADPETVFTSSVAVSPDYEHDHTLFLAGGYYTGAIRAPLLVSRDGAASWQRVRALGLSPVLRLVLPPAYPRDHRLFALTTTGLQVSRDGGDTFETLVPLPVTNDPLVSTDVVVSPAFDRGDPSILLVAGHRLWEYRDDTGSLESVVLRGEPAAHLVSGVGYSSDEPGEPTVIVSTRLPGPLGDPGLHLNRCHRSRSVLGTSIRELDCVTVRVSLPATELPLRLSPAFRPGLLFLPVPLYPQVSVDGGRTFRPARPSWEEAEYTYRIHDLAALPSASGEAAVVAQHSQPGYQLARTDDAGRTWTSLKVDLPNFLWAMKVAVTPTGRIIAGSGTGGLACSEDGGQTWARLCPTPEP